jgi:glycosyltransferase involved in cell wall biosynthesis
MTEELRNEGILCFSSAPWHGLWTRKQLIMKKLSARNRVMYVEPQLSAAYLLRFRRDCRLGGNGLYRDGDVAVFSPPAAFPAHTRSRTVHRLSLGVLRARIRRVLGELGWNPTILWYYDPALAGLRHAWPGASVAYDCVDRHSAYTGRGKLVRELEAGLVSCADSVVVTSRALVSDLAHIRGDIVRVPNGVDLSLFTNPVALPAGTTLPSRPRIGFIGGIGDWIDVGLLDHVAARHPEWSLCLGGPVAGGVQLGALPQRPNVWMPGMVPRQEVPAFLREMDVCILPFKVNRLTAAVNPLKLFEYFAAGKPVVSTHLEEVRPFEPLVAVADTREEFTGAIARLLSADDGMDPERRLRAKEHSWAVLLPRLEMVVAAGVAARRAA